MIFTGGPESDLREAIIASATMVLGDSGLTGCTVESIATSAGCAKGLVNYHFQSKTELLRIVGDRLRAARVRTRVVALEKGGAAGLDALWGTLTREVRSGEMTAWLSLLTHPPTAAAARLTPLEVAQIGTAMSASLGDEPGVDPHLATAALDAFQLLLLGGKAEPAVREAYDRFWLALLT